MGLRAGAGPAVLVSALVVVGGVGVLVVGGGSSTGSFGWVLIAVGVLFGAVNLVLLLRGR